MNYPLFSDEFFMNEAIKEAEKARERDEVPVGAVIVAGNKIIARGYNRTEELQDVTAHAEILSITSASEFLGAKYLTDCSLFVTLEPCLMCAAALKWAQIGRLIYGAKDGREGYTSIHSPVLHPKTQVLSGVLGNECEIILRDFFKGKRG